MSRERLRLLGNLFAIAGLALTSLALFSGAEAIVLRAAVVALFAGIAVRAVLGFVRDDEHAADDTAH